MNQPCPFFTPVSVYGALCSYSCLALLHPAAVNLSHCQGPEDSCVVQAFIPYHVGMHYLQHVFWGVVQPGAARASLFTVVAKSALWPLHGPRRIYKPRPLFRSDHFQPAPIQVRDFLYAKRLCLPFQQDAHFLVAALQPSLGRCCLAGAHRQRCFRARWTLDG